jgi:hypothetical protein
MLAAERIPTCGRVEQSADAIIAGTNDPDVQLAALRWKIEAVPALRAALFQPDPAIAALDAVVLCNQMVDYFETGPGKQSLGPAASARAAATSREMRDELNRVLASGTFSHDISRGAVFAQAWAAEHPIRHSIADRESALTMVFERGESAAAAGITPGQAIADANTNMDDLNRKVEVYTDQLFRQARWEAEQFTRERVAEMGASAAVPRAERAMASVERAAAMIERVGPTFERALVVAQTAPAVVTSEREAALKTVRDEVTATTRFAHDERLAAMEQVAQERETAMEELRLTINQQREQLTADVNRLTVLQIDYITRRMTLLVVIALAAAVVAALLALFLARRLFARRAGRPLHRIVHN